MGAASRWCLRAAWLVSVSSALVGVVLPGCQFPNYTVVQSGGAGAQAAGGASGAGTHDDGGAPLPDGGAGEGAEAGGGAKAGNGGSAGTGPEPCPPDACQALAPTRWEGPIAFWEGSAAEADDPPDCPPGYTDPSDWFHGLVAPDGECKCTCAEQGQSCEKNVELSIYADQNCGQPCGTVSAPADLACTTVVSDCSGSQGSMHSDRPTPSGGACKPSVTPIPEPTWERGARICMPSNLQICSDSDHICAPAAPSPYVEVACVKRVLMPGEGTPACPAGYPEAKPRLYAEYADERSCSTCVCSALSGGSCTGTVAAYSGSDCSAVNGGGGGPPTYTLGNTCQTFDLGAGSGVHPTRIRADYNLTPGACSVVTPSKAGGSATESGTSVLVCCEKSQVE